MIQLPHTRSCFVCGEANPLGLKLRFETPVDGSVVRARFVPKPEHIGFRDTVHGGITATVLDEIMVWACAVRTGKFGYCAELSLRFLNPAKPGEEVIATGELTANRRNKVFETKGDIRNPAGVVLATATGKYLPLKESQVPVMLADFVGDPDFRAKLRIAPETP